MPSLLTVARLVCASALALTVLALFPAGATSSTPAEGHDLFNPAAHIDESQIMGEDYRP